MIEYVHPFMRIQHSAWLKFTVMQHEDWNKRNQREQLAITNILSKYLQVFS